MATIEHRIGSLEQILCKHMEDNMKIKQFLLSNFPDTAQSLMSEEKGMIVEKRGEGIVIRKCRTQQNESHLL